MRILFLVPYPPGEAPSQRFRFEQYLPLLKEHGIDYTVQPFLSAESWKVLYKKGSGWQKAGGVVAGFFRRFKMLFRLHRYSGVFIHREASPMGPPLFEWLIAKAWRKPIIYDFDDAIWIPNISEANRLASFFKFHRKVAAVCRWSHTISCGNSYLARFARQHSAARVVVNPTTIDTLHLELPPKKQRANEPLVIGWTGTHSTLKYLKELQPALHQLAEEYPQVSFQLISNQPPDFQLPRMEYIPWKKSTEMKDLQRFDIGLMPLTADRWSEGKCGFKALQYMALGIPAVASPVGVNKEIIQHGRNGFLADTPDEWLLYLGKLIQDPELRQELGQRGRQTVTGRFSVEANAGNFLDLFAGFAGSNTTRAAT
ncbi:glycosyltransferase family 4 protein [Nafulsella turpanensis]|uniref:glycosyltransferase family 4 protein n=1 Tax=Nafulsella turpanensis TaxID=1265690 RepID=UPI000345D7F2|nr:glycosyltransferase family 4 protein [Nafulsella turpanensis]